MADRSTQLLLDALRRAAAEPAGLPLFKKRAGLGLFSATAAGRACAKRAIDSNLLALTGPDYYTASQNGLSFLFDNDRSKQVLEDCARAIEARQKELRDIAATLQTLQASMSGLQTVVGMATRRCSGPVDSHSSAILNALLVSDSRGASADVPLPELFRRLGRNGANISIGRFHDEIRRLKDQGQVYLHPWTGPLYSIPEPEFALLIGHEIGYYVSARQQPNGNPVVEKREREVVEAW